MNSWRSSLVLAAAALVATTATAQTPAPAPAAKPVSGIDRSAIDPAVRPQDDLYRHVNGRWLQTATFRPDQAYIGVSEHMYDETQAHLRMLVEAAQRRANDPEAARIGDLYASFMDEAAIEKLGLKPLAAELAAIDAVTDRQQFAALMPRLARFGVGMPVDMYIGQDDRDATRYVPSLVQSGLGLPNRDYYLKLDDAKFAGVRVKYAEYLAKLLTLAGATAADAEPAARAVLALETEIARVQWSAVENRDPIKSYNRIKLGALPALAPGLDWPAYLASAGLAGKTPDLLVRQPRYLKGLGGLA